ncbi:hypothetical protein [Streptomyces sp. NPDC018584]|uniref:hypothetical protein n=1 Tax=unclassified Streptomyces TaxID=2593676 RepID=UPI00379AB492
MIIKRLDLHLTYKEATRSLHEWAEITTRLGKAPRYGVRIGQRVYVAGRMRWPIYLVDTEADDSAEEELEMAS